MVVKLEPVAKSSSPIIKVRRLSLPLLASARTTPNRCPLSVNW